MFNLSGSEIVVILLLALVVLGPDKLPEAMRKAGKTWAELRKLSSGFQEEVRKGFDEPTTEVRQTAAAIKKAATLPKNPVKGAVKSLLEPPKTATATDTTATDTTATPSADAAEAAEVAATIDAEVDAAAVVAQAPIEPTAATPTEPTAAATPTEPTAAATPPEPAAATPPEPAAATPTEPTAATPPEPAAA
ncbi:Sec-independent protein translocase subunit TatA/TatB, partial [Desertimonas flava]